MLYPQRYGEPKPTKPVGMPCGLKPGGSVRQSRGTPGPVNAASDRTCGRSDCLIPDTSVPMGGLEPPTFGL